MTAHNKTSWWQTQGQTRERETLPNPRLPWSSSQFIRMFPYCNNHGLMCLQASSKSQSKHPLSNPLWNHLSILLSNSLLDLFLYQLQLHSALKTSSWQSFLRLHFFTPIIEFLVCA